MKYKVWFSLERAYQVEADNEKEARDKIINSNGLNNVIIEEVNHEWIETEDADNPRSREF